MRANKHSAFFSFFKSYSPRQKQLKQYLQIKWGVQPREIVWYEKALRHKSVIGSGKYEHLDCNERLELLGDAVLDTVITEFLFKRYPSSNEGSLTKLRSRIVNRGTLGDVGKASELHTVIEARIGNEDSMDKIVGNALEAWLGAIYIDRGFKVAKKSIEHYLIPKYIDIESIVEQSYDFKSKLIEWAQREKKKINFNTSNNTDEDQCFSCAVVVNEVLLATAKEKSKKKAEQRASELACTQLNL